MGASSMSWLCVVTSVVLPIASLAAGAAVQHEGPGRTILPLDGDWLLAVDPQNAGLGESWWTAPVAEAKTTKVPWIIQDAFPGYHGVAWYWRNFECPLPTQSADRFLLRFWQVDYKADVWLNDEPVGSHEGAESPFTFDVTELVKPGATNRLAVRVLNPTNEPIDGIVLAQVPHRNKVVDYWAGASYNHGGIVDSVELVRVPAVYIADVFALPNCATASIRVRTSVQNARPDSDAVHIECSVASARDGATIHTVRAAQVVQPGASEFDIELPVPGFHLWELNNPYLYRVTVRLVSHDETSPAADEFSVRCGFRDFRFENGYFRMNGRRLFLRSSHTGNHCPIGLQLPHDPDILRRDLVNVKAMGFNAIRFIAGVPLRSQLDLCDEIGLLVYNEPYAAWCLEESPHMGARFDESILEMVRRDRNHPSIVIWGLLNETPDGALFRHAVGILPRLRALDDSRMVMLNSGRWDGQDSHPAMGLSQWSDVEIPDPNVCFNGADHPISAYGVTWPPGAVSLHPGSNGEWSVLRWTAPRDGACAISGAYFSIAERATTDVHVMHNGTALFSGLLNLQGHGPRSEFQLQVAVAEGDTVDFVVGTGDGFYGADSTALEVTLRYDDGTEYDPGRGVRSPQTPAGLDQFAFSVAANPNGPWSYGVLDPGAAPDTATLRLYTKGRTHDDSDAIGSLSNPYSETWEHVLHDQHCYPRVPHTADIVRSLREYTGGGHPAGMGEGGYPSPPPGAVDLPVFLSEYGIGSAVDLVRVTRWYEQLGATHAEDAHFYRAQLDRFMLDWAQWKMADTFGRAEDYFAHCIAKMAAQRSLGLNAIRSNRNFVGFSLTGAVDQGMTGEGLTTTFRELKPGTFDAVFDGFAPLRWCLFAEPVHIYRGHKIRLEAVLANEDVLAPGTYPVRFEVFGEDAALVFSEHAVVTFPSPDPGAEPPFALPIFAEEVALDVPEGTYRFVATFEHGGAAAGAPARFYVSEPAIAAPGAAEVLLWGDDEELKARVHDLGFATRPFDPADSPARGVILVGSRPPDGDPGLAFQTLAARMAAGATVIFLAPEVFADGDDRVHWLPLEPKGVLRSIGGWLYLKDEWVRRHPIFAGLPSGGLMDYDYYRELIPDLVWSGQPPADETIAAANKTSQGYDSGVMMAVYRVGSGRFIINTLRIRENLGKHPAADRLLRNLLAYGAEVARGS